MAGGSRYTASKPRSLNVDRDEDGFFSHSTPFGPTNKGNEEFLSPFEFHSQSGQSGFLTSNATPMEESPQLRNQRQQWDAKRDIEPGLVSGKTAAMFGGKNGAPPPPPPPGHPPSFRSRQLQETAPRSFFEEGRKTAK
eukprot:10506378-Ditylum_brightwellii.AAC.1